jgi:hypothetical protein
VRHLPTSSPPPKTPSHAPSLLPSRAALATSNAAPDWQPCSRRYTQPNAVILFREDAYWCPLQHIQNSAWDQSRGDQDLLHIGRCSLFWIQPAHAPINPSVYHNMFPDVSYVFPQRISQNPSRCPQERMWRADYHWTSLSCSHPPISQTGDYAERSLCVHHVPYYLWYYNSNPF